MDIRIWFGHHKTRVMERVDELINNESMTSKEQRIARQEIADRFDKLLDTIQGYEDECEKLKADIRRDNELIRMLCGGES